MGSAESPNQRCGRLLQGLVACPTVERCESPPVRTAPRATGGGPTGDTQQCRCSRSRPDGRRHSRRRLRSDDGIGRFLVCKQHTGRRRFRRKHAACHGGHRTGVQSPDGWTPAPVRWNAWSWVASMLRTSTPVTSDSAISPEQEYPADWTGPVTGTFTIAGVTPPPVTSAAVVLDAASSAAASAPDYRGPVSGRVTLPAQPNRWIIQVYRERDGQRVQVPLQTLVRPGRDLRPRSVRNCRAGCRQLAVRGARRAGRLRARRPALAVAGYLQRLGDQDFRHHRPALPDRQPTRGRERDLQFPADRARHEDLPTGRDDPERARTPCWPNTRRPPVWFVRSSPNRATAR